MTRRSIGSWRSRKALYAQPGKRFEDGVAASDGPGAGVAAVSVPRGGSRSGGACTVEQACADASCNCRPSPRPSEHASPPARERAGVKGRVASAAAAANASFIDEYALASRLSYFLWSTMPDDELFRLAERRELRKNLAAQVKRMLADRARRRWSRTSSGNGFRPATSRASTSTPARCWRATGGRSGTCDRSRQRFQELREIPEEKLTPEQKSEIAGDYRAAVPPPLQRNRPSVELDRDLRRALRQETEHGLRSRRCAKTAACWN